MLKQVEIDASGKSEAKSEIVIEIISSETCMGVETRKIIRGKNNECKIQNILNPDFREITSENQKKIKIEV